MDDPLSPQKKKENGGQNAYHKFATTRYDINITAEFCNLSKCCNSEPAIHSVLTGEEQIIIK